jgi:uncharacterized protein YbjT (DUF2867 family)
MIRDLRFSLAPTGWHGTLRMNVILFGATGMVGSAVLIECLDDARVSAVLAVGRSPCGVAHPKLTELIRSDFFDWSDALDLLGGYDACFFCLGVSAAGKDEATYTRLTHTLTMAAAGALAERSPGITFCYVSGQGTDSSEKGRFMWARVKGRTENDLLKTDGLDAYMFRPGYIQPMKGVRSGTRLYQAAYSVVSPLYPLAKRLFPRHMTTSVDVGRAMIEVADGGYPRRLLEVADINALSSRAGGTH